MGKGLYDDNDCNKSNVNAVHLCICFSPLTDHVGSPFMTTCLLVFQEFRYYNWQ